MRELSRMRREEEVGLNLGSLVAVGSDPIVGKS